MAAAGGTRWPHRWCPALQGANSGRGWRTKSGSEAGAQSTVLGTWPWDCVQRPAARRGGPAQGRAAARRSQQGWGVSVGHQGARGPCWLSVLPWGLIGALGNQWPSTGSWGPAACALPPTAQAPARLAVGPFGRQIPASHACAFVVGSRSFCFFFFFFFAYMYF